MVRLGRTLTVVLALVAILAAAAVAGLGLYAYGHQGRVYQGVSVGNVDLSGMTRAEAVAALQGGYAAYMNAPLTLQNGTASYVISPNQLGLRLDADASVDKALAYGRTGSWWHRSQAWARGLFSGHDVPATVASSGDLTNASLISLTPDVAKAPANASIDFSDAAPSVIPDVPGVGFDYGATRAAILDRVARQSYQPVFIATTVLTADVTEATLNQTLPTAQKAVAGALSITGLSGMSWSLDQAQLKSLVSVSADGTTVVVNRDALKKLVDGIASSVERPSKDAILLVDGSGELTVVPGVDSISVDAAKSTDGLAEAIASGSQTYGLVTKETPPKITTEMADGSMASIKKTVAKGLTVKWDGGSGQLTQADLLAALLIKPTPGKDQPFAFSFSKKVLRGYLDVMTKDIQVEPREAKFRLVNGKVTAVEKGRTGIVVNFDDSADRIEKAVFAGYSSSSLMVDEVKARYSASDAAKIQLPDVLGEAATPYSSSTEARKTNVERAVDLETGWLVAPGDTFSYDETMGQVTEDNGFVVGLGILADPDHPGQVTTGPVVGGGICQVSTTIFQSAFWSGLPFLERYQHPYWINSYGIGEGGMKGLDAMVNIEPEGSTEALTLDMRFQNTTGNWIALELTADGENVTSRILGTNPGWDVEIAADDPEISDIVKPDETPIRQESPELPAGQEMTVESAQDGFSTLITRTVTDKDGTVVDVYQLASTYSSTSNRVLVGTGS
jgi:vancomycin resistance protein YoaR